MRYDLALHPGAGSVELLRVMSVLYSRGADVHEVAYRVDEPLAALTVVVRTRPDGAVTLGRLLGRLVHVHDVVGPQEVVAAGS